MGKRDDTKARNRQEILEAAARVFQRQGYERTTVRDIIRDTKLASGTFYNYFKSVEQVLDAIAKDIEGGICTSVIASKPQTARQFWESLCRSVFAQAQHFPLAHVRIHDILEWGSVGRFYTAGSYDVLARFVIGTLQAVEGRENAVSAAAGAIMRAQPVLP